MNIPERGFYYHYKHDPAGSINNYAYEVVGVARHTEEPEFFVLYRPLYESDWFKPADYQVRPLEMFMESVTVKGRTAPRFTRIIDANVIAELEQIKSRLCP